MTPKEKANELIDRMHLFSCGDSGKDDLTKANAKQCALIVVKEIMNSDEGCTMYMHDVGVSMFVQFWNQVKSEIQIL
jgi:hypothetical protein